MLSNEKYNNIKKAISFDIIPSDKHKLSFYDEISGGIDGSRKKQFVRSDNAIFKGLFEELQKNKNCSYITYANSVIKQGFLPQKLSTLIKYLDSTNLLTTDSVDYVVQEVLAGQLLNYYGANTCFNIATCDSIINDYQVVSVDFVAPNSEFYSFDELNFVLGADIDRDLSYQLSELYNIDELKGAKKKEIDKLCEQYAYSYLIRKFVFRDGDFAHTNCGFLRHENGKLDFINFDFEFCFDLLDFGEPLDEKEIKRDIKLINIVYPQLVKKFVKKSQELYEGLLYFKGKLSCPLEEHAICLDKLTNNLEQVLRIAKTLEPKTM